MANGTIILLNGSSSAGKTTLARAIQQEFADSYLHLGIDTFHTHVWPQAYFANRSYWEVGLFKDALIAGLHEAVAALAAKGHNVVVDHWLGYPSWLDDCVTRWHGLPVLFVGVRCSRGVLAARAAQRTNRRRPCFATRGSPKKVKKRAPQAQKIW